MSKKPKPRILGAEPLEERLPVSSSAAGVLFGFGLAQNEPWVELSQNEPGVERSATPGYEASQTQHTESIAQQSAPIDLTLDLQLDAIAVDLVHSEESFDAISSAADDPFILTPLTPDVALSDTNDDAHRELGDELLLFQISTLDYGRVDTVTPLQTPSGAIFHGESFWSDVSRLDARSGHDTGRYAPRESGVIMPLEQAVHDHDCCDDDDPMTPTRSGGGGSGGTSGGGNSGGGCTSGGSGQVPYFVGGPQVTQPSILVLDANNLTYTYSQNIAGWFTNPCGIPSSHGPMTFSVVQGGNTAPAIVTLTSSGGLTVKSNGSTGTGAIVIQASNGHGYGDTFTINVYSYMVTGYTLWERCWDEGVAEVGWHQVEDSGSDWALLWQENDYLWKPTITPAPNSSDWVRTMTVSDNGTIIAGGTGNSLLQEIYNSGGSYGVGGVNTPAPSGVKSIHWPCAYGTPMQTGERNIGMTVHIAPQMTPFMTVLNSAVTLSLKKTPPSAKQPKVGVTAIASMVWQPIDGATNKIRLAYSQAASGNGIGLRCFPEQDSPNASVNDQIDVKVTLAAPVPTGMTGTVHLAWFDPDNPKGSTKTPATNGKGTRDNHGSIKFVNSPTNLLTLTFSTTTNAQTQLARMQFVKIPGGPLGADAAHAGDNYIVAAHPNKNPPGTAGIVDTWRFKSDGVTLEYPVGDGTVWKTLDGNHQTDLLTVWRSLWVERDAMADPQATATDGFDPAKKGTGEGQWNTFVPTPEPKDFDLFLGPLRPGLAYLSMAMVAACIEVKEVDQSPANSSWITGDSATINPGAWDVYTTPFVHNLPDKEPSTITNIGKLSRDVNVNKASFWCIQGIGAYEYTIDSDNDGEIAGILGCAVNNAGVFMVFDETIRDDSNTSSGCKSSVTVGFLTTFHEVLHLFDLVHSDGGVMSVGARSGSEMAVLPDGTPEPHHSETANTRSDYLLPEHIKKVQAKDYPR